MGLVVYGFEQNFNSSLHPPFMVSSHKSWCVNWFLKQSAIAFAFSDGWNLRPEGPARVQYGVRKSPSYYEVAYEIPVKLYSCHYVCILIHWRRVHFWKLTVAQLLKEICGRYEKRRRATECRYIDSARTTQKTRVTLQTVCSLTLKLDIYNFNNNNNF
jgi:hypothetical protein